MVPESGDVAPVISVTGVSKRYLIYERPEHRLWQGLFRGRKQFFKDFWALRELSFDVERGETVGIIGPNGSGKSTLLQLICGTLSPTTGTVRLNGRLAALLELGSGFNAEFTGRENVYLNGTILGLSRREIDARFDRIASFADIGQFIDQPVKTYSSGMVVRLAFAVVANVDADVLVIDEALAVGDALFTQKCMRFLRSFQERGTILFVSHDTGAVLNLCRRALWLSHGRLVQAGPAKTVVEGYMRANVEMAQGLAASGDGFTAKSGEPPAAGSVEPVRSPAQTVEEASSPAKAEIAQSLEVSGDGSDTSAGAPLAAGSGEAVPTVADAELAASSLFDPAGPPFGAGGAVIQSVTLIGEAGRAVSTVKGGELVTLRIEVAALRNISSAIVGFLLKDRLGQVVFGENTWLSTRGAPVALLPGDVAAAEFRFEVPRLGTGKYALDVAVAEGTQDQHVQHQWFFDAGIIQVITDRPVFGMFAVHPAQVHLTRRRTAALSDEPRR